MSKKYIGMYEKYDREESLHRLAKICVGLLCVCIILLAALNQQLVQKKAVVNHIQCTACHNYQMTLAKHFKKKGSRSPEEMANAVLKTKNPRLLAAMAIVETDGNPRVRNTGYKKKHQGAFQVNPAIWQAVPEDAAGQAKQAELILNELTERYPTDIHKVLNSYGGDTRGKYSVVVLNELLEVPK